MNRLIVTFVIGNLPWAERVLPYMRSYASGVGADFLEVKWLRDPKKFNDNPCYSCVQHLKSFAGQSFYEEVLFLDCDVLVLPGCPNLFDFPGDLVVTHDQVWKTKDSRYRAWLERNFPTSSEMTAEGRYFNAGVMLFRLAAAKKMNLDGPYPDDFANDQDFLNMRAGEAGLEVNFIPDNFNQRQVGGNAITTMRENYILHFVGGLKTQINRYCDILKMA